MRRRKETALERMVRLKREVERAEIKLSEFRMSNTIREYERLKQARHRKKNKLKWLTRWHGNPF